MDKWLSKKLIGRWAEEVMDKWLLYIIVNLAVKTGRGFGGKTMEEGVFCQVTSGV